MGLPAGRIALDRIANDWSENQPLNHRLLAAEVADAIRSMGQPGTPVPPDCAVIVGVLDSTAGLNSVTMWAVADYFDGMSMGQAPATIATTNGGARAGTVLLARYWIDRLATEATERAAVATGLAQAIETPPRRSNGSAAPAYIEPEPPSGSDPVCLAIRQEQQRQEGEQIATKHLEAERIARQRAERASAEKDAIIAAKNAQLQLTLEEGEGWRREAIEERRGRLLAEEAVEEERCGRFAAEEKLQDLAGLRPLLEKVAAWPKQAKKLDPRERTTFEQLLYVLARKAGYKLEKPYSDEDAIRLHADTIGAKVPEGKGSIAKKLEAAVARHEKDAKEAEEDR